MYPYNLNKDIDKDIYTAERINEEKDKAAQPPRNPFLERPHIERPPQGWPPQGWPPQGRPPQERPPQERPHIERPHIERPPQERPPHERPPQERPPFSGHGNPPSRRPPEFIPKREHGIRLDARAVDPGSLGRCINSMVYVWLRNGENMWMYPVFIGNRSISGYIWTKFGWAYIGFDLDLIESFFCFG